jgi:predicted HicB family RNase H-like nuclease
MTDKIFTTAGGDELSEDDLDALADEAERGYDLEKAKRVTVGRPSLGTAGVSPRVQVRVDPDLAQALQARAQKEQRSVSEIARTALREYVERAA